MPTTRRLLTAALLAAATLVPLVAVAPVAAADPPSGKLLLMLDASGSMNDPDPSGTTKLVAAQRALTSVVDGLPDGAQVGLRLYGATVDVPSPTPQSCADSQLVAPIAPLDRPALRTAVDAVKAVGDTPIAYALGEGANDLGTQGKRNIVLVSDGQENCVPDPCPAIRQLVAGGVDLQIDTVGFGVDDTARAQLQCIAGAGRGTYYDARDAGQLSASLTKLSQRALRTFNLAGTPVTAADRPEAAPVLAPGQYTDSFVRGAAERYYRVTRSPGSTLRVSATSRPPKAGSDIFEQTVMSIRTPGGTTCDSDTPTRTDIRGDNLAVVASVLVPQASGGKECAAATDLVLAVSRPRGEDGTVPMEVLVSEEPAVTSTAGLPGPVTDAEITPLFAPATDPSTRVVGGGSFSDAPPLTAGTYVDTVLPGEQVFYKVKVEFGQRLAFTVDAPAPGQALDLGNFATVYYSVDAWAPDRSPLTRSSGEPSTTGVLVQRTLNLLLGQYTAPVRYQNRTAPSSLRGAVGDVRLASIDGYYYVAVGRSRAKASEPKESVPMDVRLRVAVEGEPTGRPAYASPAGVTGLDPATSSSTTSPSTAGSTTTPPRATATATATATDGTVVAGAETSSGTVSVPWAVIGVVLLAAAAGLGVVAWRRRGSAGPGQPGGGSQA